MRLVEGCVLALCCVAIAQDVPQANLNSPNSSRSQSCSPPTSGGVSSFWYENIDHNGLAPFYGDSSYVVFRNVLDYQADNTGESDASGAIQNALKGMLI